MKLKKEIPLTIPNKKINHSPQFRNYLPGTDIEFEQLDNRVTIINSMIMEMLKCKTPVYDLANNVLTVTCETEGAQIYYTTNGTMPTVASTLYEDPIQIQGDTDFRFAAYKNGMISSDELEVTAELQLSAPIISLDYKTGEVLFDNPNSIGDVYYKIFGMDDFAIYDESVYISAAQTVRAKVVYGDYSSEIESQQYLRAFMSARYIGYHSDNNTCFVIFYSPIENAEFRHSIDGSVPLYTSEDGSEVNTFIFGNPLTVKCRVFSEGCVPSAVDTVNLGFEKPTSPVISVDNGNVVMSKAGETVNIIDTKIHYTTDGSTPNAESTLYNEPFAAVSGQTVKAITICYDTCISDVSELTIP